MNSYITAQKVKNELQSAGLWVAASPTADVARTHRISNAPFAISQSQYEILQRFGSALLAFYRAANKLYMGSEHRWTADYLDIGKPGWLIEHSRAKYQKNEVPRIIRPDILVCDGGGFRITELDSVPGGFGHLSCLGKAYEEDGFELVGGARGVAKGFAEMLRDAAAKSRPACAIAVSDESADYRAEMDYIARELNGLGVRAKAVRPEELVYGDGGVCADEIGRVDIVYRFFELFDNENIPNLDKLIYAAQARQVAVTPPIRHQFEEKLLLALFHNERLADFWVGELGESDYALLKSSLGETWVMDSRPLPPHAEISGLRWRGKPVSDFRELASGTQKERRFVIKPSGFSPLAWGSRGVKIGHDMPAGEWSAAIDAALDGFQTTPSVLQPFYNTDIIPADVHDFVRGRDVRMETRVRLCPYYFVSGKIARLGGVLATACPKNKKLIHGMGDAVMSPCVIG